MALNIAIASGKGGTGKTTIATNLAVALSNAGQPVQLLDCDVEEPNCHLFLKPQIQDRRDVYVAVPQVDESLCTGCGRCGEVCQYSAIVCMPSRGHNSKARVLTFPELCHACGGCALACPAGAITEGQRQLGEVEIGRAGDIAFAHGKLRVGEAMSPPLIRAVGAAADPECTTLIDAPPGTSCPVITAVMGADFAMLVTEPTPFGLNDLVLAVETVRELGMPFGVVINRSDVGDRRVTEYCLVESIPVLAELPDDRRVAECYSEGLIAADAVPGFGSRCNSLFAAIEQELS